jgi:hypothetical protein
VSTPSGEVPIESLVAGDLIYCTSPDGNRTTGTVAAVYPASRDTWRSMELSNGRVLSATPDHPIRSGGQWIQAESLAVGHTLDSPAGTVSIIAISEQTSPVSVYDISVSPWPNFIAEGVIVHNKRPKPRAAMDFKHIRRQAVILRTADDTIYRVWSHGDGGSLSASWSNRDGTTGTGSATLADPQHDWFSSTPGKFVLADDTGKPLLNCTYGHDSVMRGGVVLDPGESDSPWLMIDPNGLLKQDGIICTYTRNYQTESGYRTSHAKGNSAWIGIYANEPRQQWEIVLMKDGALVISHNMLQNDFRFEKWQWNIANDSPPDPIRPTGSEAPWGWRIDRAAIDRGNHILTVDLTWSRSGKAERRTIDLFPLELLIERLAVTLEDHAIYYPPRLLPPKMK